MEIWLDTIDLDVIKDATRIGVISGVTTNPSILSGTRNVRDTLHQLLHIQPGPVAVQVTSQDTEGMVDEARHLCEFSNRILVKIPINHNGLAAINELKQDRIPILGTAVLLPTQALLAANHNIAYIAPYFSHMENAHETLKVIVDMFKNSKTSTKILAASLKQLEHIIYCAQNGVEAVTIKADLYQQLVADHAAVEGFSQRFLSEWSRSHGSISIAEACEKSPSDALTR